jgi:hypothetical protein
VICVGGSGFSGGLQPSSALGVAMPYRRLCVNRSTPASPRTTPRCPRLL